MSEFLDQVKQIFDNVKSAPTKGKASFTIPKQGSTPFASHQHYIQILVNEMYLANERNWWVHYSPVALVATTYLYENDYTTVPIVVGPALFKQFSEDVGTGTLIRNAPVTSLHPYQGGAVTVTLVFSKVDVQDSSHRVLDVLESFATVANPLAPTIPFESYLKIAGSVMNGMRVVFNLPKTQPILAYRETINPQINQSLEPLYLVLIDAPNLTEADKKKFSVTQGRLYWDDNKTGALPYRANDFILLEIAQGDKRTDERILAFYPLWEQTRKLGLQAAKQAYFWEEAKHHFNALKVAVHESPDLTEPDIKRLTGEYLQKLREIRQGESDEQNLKIEAQSAETLTAYQQIAKQLDELDEL